MTDPIPEGCITLVELRELYLQHLWNGNEPAAELRDKVHSIDLPPQAAQEHIDRIKRLSDCEWEGLLEPFASGRIEALVRPPEAAENFSIPRDAWESMFYRERPFLALQIVPGLGDYWNAIAGRTPFVRRTEVKEWFATMEVTIVKLLGRRQRLHTMARDVMLGFAQEGQVTPGEAEGLAKRWGMPPFQESPNIDRFDPMAQAIWTLPMAIAWLARRTPEAVRDEWDSYRQECWRWRAFHRRLPVDGGKSWRDVQGFELVQRSNATARELGLAEALDIASDDVTILMSIRSAREALWNTLSAGALICSASDDIGNTVSIQPREWPYLELAHSIDGPDYLIRRAQSLQPVYRNLTFASKDVVRLWKPKHNATPAEAAMTFEYPVSDRHWPLIAACVWVGAEGRSLTTEQIAGAAIDEIGAMRLFAALNQGLLSATGMNQNLIRETIPSPYWEMATLDPSVPGHLVSFIDEPARGLWESLTPSGDSEPRWSRINIDANALKKAFPFSKSQPVSCRKWLESEMHNSPTKRPSTKAELLQIARERYKVSQTAFERAWKHALESVPEARPFWTKGGRPKNPHSKPKRK